MKFRTMPLASKYCVGKGIELGPASHNPFDLPDCLLVGTCNGRDYLVPQDLNDYASYKAEQEQALVMDPENERYRKDFVALTGRAYINPLQ